MRGVAEKLLIDVTTVGSTSLWRDTYGQPYLTTIVNASGTAPSGTIVWEGTPGRSSGGIIIGPDPQVIYPISTLNVSSGASYSSITQGHRFVRHRLSSVTDSVGGPTDAPSGVFTSYILGLGSVTGI